ncbi:hypothetical protein CONPUDRAFT_154491 [Coniophora puteana RWD-64-598 SS2]|uniref:BTB domain-containing protein n=1 Tax=Coniophora puteana (strain RWD-64-598) TaxID=741705 RepID=A0A5M3MMN6_CONPW|nr:uncharacterized protein CONPUDRAFT_154491 [Coniophora puteana RWD-64-598 SS2]EIW80462.1 hypothetical protein CONPUDRAFT_154491 [Coniophora puteana RWD-64-598 SS2]
MSTIGETADWDSVLHSMIVAESLRIEQLPEAVLSLSEDSGSGTATVPQLPTPPPSTLLPTPFPLAPLRHISTTEPETTTNEHVADEETIIAVSTTFFPGAPIHPLPPDTFLVSSDSIYFFISSVILLNASSNAFDDLLTPTLGRQSVGAGKVVSLTEHSAVVNVVLHAVYDRPCSHHSPAFESLAAAVETMPKYGLSPYTYVAPMTPLYSLFLMHAPLRALDLYALAAKHNLHDLAVPTSSHLLSLALPSLTEDIAEQIDAIYLKRLFVLHMSRTEALKRILKPPGPHPHAPTASCNFDDQKRVARAWLLASSYLAWNVTPGAIETALAPLQESVSCTLCRHTLKEHLRTVIVQWSMVKSTI